MTEKIQIKGKDVWIVVEPHTRHFPGTEPKEYFTASYFLTDPDDNPAGILFIDGYKKAIEFASPVEALEYANEKLIDMQ